MSQPASRSQLYALAVGLLVVTCTLGWYAVHRQQLTDHRTEKQRQAICAILANIPGHIPPEIASARGVFARPHHPQDCDPIRHPVTPTPTPTPGQAVGPTVLVLPDGGGVSSPGAAPRPSPTPTSTHSPKPNPSPRPTDIPTPTPSPSCDVNDLIRHPLQCVHVLTSA